jgi:hypothetical protein
MKIRQGFVSNSSSSSFIIIKPTPEQKHNFKNDMEYLKNVVLKAHGYSEDDFKEEWLSNRMEMVVRVIKGMNLGENYQLFTFQKGYDDSEGESVLELLDNIGVGYVEFLD